MSVQKNHGPLWPWLGRRGLTSPLYSGRNQKGGKKCVVDWWFAFTHLCLSEGECLLPPFCPCSPLPAFCLSLGLRKCVFRCPQVDRGASGLHLPPAVFCGLLHHSVMRSPMLPLGSQSVGVACHQSRCFFASLPCASPFPRTHWPPSWVALPLASCLPPSWSLGPPFLTAFLASSLPAC